MNALLIAAHGSRQQSSNEEIQQLTSRVRKMASSEFDTVVCAFMQFGSPSITDVIDSLAASGTSRIVVFPHFIAEGSHVLHDIPDAVNAAADKYPNISFELMPHLGKLDGIPHLILTSAGDVTK